MTFEHDFGWSLPPGCTTLPGEEPIPDDWEQCSNCEEFEPPEDVKDEICKHCLEEEMATPSAPLPID